VTGDRYRPLTTPAAPRAQQVPWRPAEPLPAPRCPVIEPPREVHLHFHGVTAEDAAAIVADMNRDRI